MDANTICLVAVVLGVFSVPSYGRVLRFQPHGFHNGGPKLYGNRSLQSWKREIASYKRIANDIIKLSIEGPAQNQSYNRLAEFVDKFGYRLAGTKNLEDSIDYMVQQLKDDGLENVHTEPVTVPVWVRGSESAMLIHPRRKPLAILGLGSSIGTPVDGIQAEVLVVRSFDELRASASQAKGKIVVFNQEYVSYGITVSYRTQGAVEAAKVGAVASLIRSVTPFSIYSPHTGHQDYDDKVRKIPTACITVEDAEMLDRMQQRGEKMVINLKMEAHSTESVKSRNTIAEIVGREHPEQVVVFSGHIDSWDVGQGAMDDGGGVFVSWQALSLIKQLGLRPRRTMRLILWTTEEPGGIGGAAYYQAHKENITNFDMVMETDSGTFTPNGITFNGNKKAMRIMKEVMKLLQPIHATKVTPGGADADILDWANNGVPSVGLDTQNSKYFYFHHTDGDTMTVQNPIEMNLCSALWSVVAYTVADYCDMLPR